MLFDFPIDIKTVLLISISISFSVYLLHQYLQKRWIKQRQRRGVIKEAEAKKLLEKKGYRVLEYQPEFSYTATEGNKDVVIMLRPDYLVEKGGKLFCVEVKTGHGADGLSNKNTRRQILEYSCFIKCSGVLFVDMENKEIKKIAFPKPSSTWKTAVIFLLLGIIVFLLFQMNSFV